MSKRPPELAVEGLTKVFPGTRALDDLEVESGPIVGSVVQKSYDELWLACWMLYWLNHEQLKPAPDWEAAGITPSPRRSRPACGSSHATTSTSSSTRRRG